LRTSSDDLLINAVPNEARPPAGGRCLGGHCHGDCGGGGRRARGRGRLSRRRDLARRGGGARQSLQVCLDGLQRHCHDSDTGRDGGDLHLEGGDLGAAALYAPRVGYFLGDGGDGLRCGAVGRHGGQQLGLGDHICATGGVSPLYIAPGCVGQTLHLGFSRLESRFVGCERLCLHQQLVRALLTGHNGGYAVVLVFPANAEVSSAKPERFGDGRLLTLDLAFVGGERSCGGVEGRVGPARAGCCRVGFLLDAGLGFCLEGGDQSFTVVDSSLVGLGDVRRAAGRVDVGLTLVQHLRQVGQLLGPSVPVSPCAGHVGPVAASSLNDSLNHWTEKSLFARFVA